MVELVTGYRKRYDGGTVLMLLTFCINEMEVHVKRDTERLLHISAAHVAAIQINPTTTSSGGSAIAARDAVIYGNGQQFRVPFIGRNLTAVSAWQDIS